MTIQDLKTQFTTDLSDIYPKYEIQSFFFLLIENKLGLKRVDLALNPQLEISQKDKLYFNDALSRLKKQEPIQYIIGSTAFYSLPFKVNKNVLIPRPETEELVAWILEEVRSLKLEVGSRKTGVNVTLSDPETSGEGSLIPPQTLNILDIGTGSGCIAIALAKNLPNATVWALEVLKKALKIAQENANLNKVKINFIEADILKTVTLSDPEASGEGSHHLKFDIIVSNPPYVRQLEKKQIKDNVLKHEPHLALFVADNNPLLFYDKIVDFATKNLTQNGVLYFEINQYLGTNLISLLREKGFKNVELKQDVFGVDRMVKAAR